MNRDILTMGLRPKVKRPPLFLLHEIATMFGMKTSKLKSMMQVASRCKREIPQIVLQAGHAMNYTISPRRNYYKKQDFVKFLEQEKHHENT